ncbi:integrase, partial [Tannerella sp. oral taxon BU063 isolate Cell 5]
TIDGKSTVMATGEECLPDAWNSRQGITGEKKINQRLATFRELVEKTYAEMLSKDGVVSAELLKNRLQGVAAAPTTLLAMSEAELQSVKACVGKSRSAGTYRNHTYSDKMLRDWIENKGRKDILIDAVTGDLFEEFRFYLKKKRFTAKTVNRHLCWLCRLMYRAVSKRIIRYNPFEDATYEKEERKIRFLQKSDIAKLMALKVNDREAELARRMFLFSCFTGLAIADMEYLKFSHIQTSADGRRYIRKERQKTKVESIVPLHPIVEEILSRCQEREGQAVKEKGDDLVFPRDCGRSVMNNKLSTVGLACGIRQRLSFHMARHTFGTLSLSAGIPIESIAKMMGHASISSTQIYAQVTDKKISEDMDKLIKKQQAASE